MSKTLSLTGVYSRIDRKHIRVTSLGMLLLLKIWPYNVYLRFKKLANVKVLLCCRCRNRYVYGVTLHRFVIL